MSEPAGDADESLVKRRSRRSTAGNRMEAALAEMALDDVAKDGEDDIDFVIGKDEEDVFESDFESTDEEVAQEDVDAGDKTPLDEEREARKAARARAKKATAAAHARQKVTFNPELQTQRTSLLSPAETRPKRRASASFAADADGDAAETKRKSRRKLTILNTSETVNRMKESEARKASAVPKRAKAQRALTQDELIARALDNEEGNTVEHRDYLKIEEEKRKRAQVVRETISGPLLRWISKGEEVKVIVEPPPATIGTIQRPGYAYSYQPVTASGSPYGPSAQSYATFYQNLASGQMYPHYSPAAFSSTPSTPSASSSSIQPLPNHAYTPYSLPPPAPLPPVERIEKVAKNYVVHEFDQTEDAEKPPWKDTMEAMFGDHVKWDEVRVLVGRGRPTSRPRPMCLITGKPAPYLDPRTGVPFADVRAFETLTRLLAHEYIWSETLGCYTSHEKQGIGAAPRTTSLHQSTGSVPVEETGVDTDVH